MMQAGCTAGELRSDLVRRGLILAKCEHLIYEMTSGSNPSLVFGTDDFGRHGNFHPNSFDCIMADAHWRLRLAKVHTASKRERVRANWRWMELDSAVSSDALLMNIFCHPGITSREGLSPVVAGLLGTEIASRPCFGIIPGVALKNGRTDRTEIDAQIGDLFIEAKLTESGFQQATLSTLERYTDLEAVFHVSQLPWTRHGVVQGYQLIRSVLAAYARNAAFCVILDARRHDLIEIWYLIMSAVSLPGLSWRLKLLTWQELLPVLPDDLRLFLATKYGLRSRYDGEVSIS